MVGHSVDGSKVAEPPGSAMGLDGGGTTSYVNLGTSRARGRHGTVRREDEARSGSGRRVGNIWDTPGSSTTHLHVGTGRSAGGTGASRGDVWANRADSAAGRTLRGTDSGYGDGGAHSDDDDVVAGNKSTARTYLSFGSYNGPNELAQREAREGLN